MGLQFPLELIFFYLKESKTFDLFGTTFCNAIWMQRG